MARKPKDHTWSIKGCWRSIGPNGRNGVVLGIVIIMILLMCILAASMNNIDKVMARELEVEQQKAATEQAKHRQVTPLIVRPRQIEQPSQLQPHMARDQSRTINTRKNLELSPHHPGDLCTWTAVGNCSWLLASHECHLHKPC